MIKVTVMAGDAKFKEFDHGDGQWAIEGNVLFIMDAKGNDKATYAAGAWLKVEHVTDVPANST